MNQTSNMRDVLTLVESAIEEAPKKAAQLNVEGRFTPAKPETMQRFYDMFSKGYAAKIKKCLINFSPDPSVSGVYMVVAFDPKTYGVCAWVFYTKNANDPYSFDDCETVGSLQSVMKNLKHCQDYSLLYFFEELIEKAEDGEGKPLQYIEF